MKLILAIVKPFKVAELVDAFEADVVFPGMTVVECRGFGRKRMSPQADAGPDSVRDFVSHELVIVAAPDALAGSIERRIEEIAHTGRPGDGKLFVLALEEAVAITTGDRGDTALR